MNDPQMVVVSTAYVYPTQEELRLEKTMRGKKRNTAPSRTRARWGDYRRVEVQREMAATQFHLAACLKIE